MSTYRTGILIMSNPADSVGSFTCKNYDYWLEHVEKENIIDSYPELSRRLNPVERIPRDYLLYKRDDTYGVYTCREILLADLIRTREITYLSSNYGGNLILYNIEVDEGREVSDNELEMIRKIMNPESSGYDTYVIRTGSNTYRIIINRGESFYTLSAVLLLVRYKCADVLLPILSGYFNMVDVQYKVAGCLFSNGLNDIISNDVAFYLGMYFLICYVKGGYPLDSYGLITANGPINYVKLSNILGIARELRAILKKIPDESRIQIPSPYTTLLGG